MLLKNVIDLFLNSKGLPSRQIHMDVITLSPCYDFSQANVGGFSLARLWCYSERNTPEKKTLDFLIFSVLLPDSHRQFTGADAVFSLVRLP